ncbi:RNA polymerase sigma factor sigD, chloroplastic isoform X1 [Magnolia sinica]|uniref:RNA polymerase sigma factor sigD, chloroplastic isoform X1 n=1 Tax=Magnolia sinica TaxID=86752 RepID=UPI00265A049B|nr:RNA polymerase sigma factor sigD, chloroplastic isoform X1 [Magnolia sinica]
MASASTAFSNPSSPTLPISLSPFAIPSKTSFHIMHPSLPSYDSLTIAAALQAVTLANAAAHAARDAVSSAIALTEIAFPTNYEFQFHKDDGTHTNLSSIASKRMWRRKKKKRKRKTATELSNLEVSSCWCSSPSSYYERYLTPTEEAQFSHYLKEGARLEAVRKRIQRTEMQEPSMIQWAEAVGMEKVSLEEKLRRARECRKRITLSYKRLVVTIATKYEGKGLSQKELVQEGCIGLLQGAERFDPKRGCKLSTYVYWWIKQAIIKAVATKSRLIRLPGSMQGLMAKIAQANNILRRRLGRWPTFDEIADTVQVDISNISLVSDRTRPPISMDQPLSNHGNITLQEIMAGPEETMPETMVARKQMKQDIDRLLKTLSGREENILRLYFGLNGETARSCDEIGRLLHLSRERVRQIQYLALRKLQQTATLYSLQSYM